MHSQFTEEHRPVSSSLADLQAEALAAMQAAGLPFEDLEPNAGWRRAPGQDHYWYIADAGTGRTGRPWLQVSAGDARITGGVDEATFTWKSWSDGSAPLNPVDLEEVKRQLAETQPVEMPEEDVVILNDAPPTITRLLSLVNGHAYAVSWVHVRRLIRERTDKAGNTIEVDPPQEEVHLERVIVRNDGKIYSNAPIPGTEPLSKLPVEFHGQEIPPEHLRWSGAGVNRFRAGERPDAVSVFSAVCAVMRHYMDFSGSFTTEDKLQELTAIWALNTYLLDAYPVVGYLWPNGEAGSGKSHLLYTLSAVSYLGFVILASGSFASIRDLAGYGATLLFDDAEKIMDPKSGDPDKQALLLAGNRKGTTVPIKVSDPANPKKWITRHINAYCPRAFSAIGLPIDTMASRTIFVPLLASANSGKANSDPLDFDAWPQGIDRRRLVDDLWALALRFLILQPVEHAIRGLAFLGEVSCASLNGSARWNATGARRIAFDAFPPLFRCIFPAAGAAEMKLQVTSARSKTRSIRSGLRCWANGK